MKNFCLKASIITSFALILTFGSQAQVTLDFGARAGINLSGVSVNEAIDTVNTGTLKSPVFNFLSYQI